MDPLARDVAAGGVRLRVSEWPGPADATQSVVLLHGLYANRTCWQPLAEAAAGRFRFIAPDLPGFGQSEKPNPSRYPYGVDAFAEAIVDMFSGLGLARAHVVGHGIGGAVAVQVAATHPELVSRLVLLDSVCYSSPLHPKLRLALTPLLGGLLFKQLLGRAAFRAFYKDRLGARVPSQHIDLYFDSLDSPAGRGALLASLRATLDTRSMVAHCRRLQTPALVVWGRQDRMIPAGLGRQLSREIPRAGFELLDAGHSVHEEEPELLWGILGRFFEGQRVGAR